MSCYSDNKRVLAIDPTSRGFGFAVLEGPECIIDWGVVGARHDKLKLCLKRVAELIDDYQPDIFVLENYAGAGSRRCLRVRRLLDAIGALAAAHRVQTRSFSRAQVRKAFSDSGASTKHEITLEIAKRFPELSPRLPPFRKPWMSEDDRMSIFDALSFALTYLLKAQKRKEIKVEQK